MIETFIIDWPIMSLLGFVFGAFAPRERWWTTRAFRAGLASAAVFTLVALISYFIAPDWMWMYFLDPSRVAWVVPVILIAYLAVFAVSFAAAIALRELGPKLVWALVAGCAVLEAAVLAITWDRYHQIGTRQQWLADAAHELVTPTPTGPARTISLLVPVFLIVLGASLVSVWRNRRPAEP